MKRKSESGTIFSGLKKLEYKKIESIKNVQKYQKSSSNLRLNSSTLDDGGLKGGANRRKGEKLGKGSWQLGLKRVLEVGI